MRKKFFRRGLALGLTLALSLGLCACGGKGKNMENAALAKEYVYRLQPIEMPQLTDNESGNTNIMQTIHRDGKIYVLMQAYSWDEITYESINRYCILSMNEDGSGMELTDIQIPEEEESAGEGEGDGEVDVPETDNDINQPAEEGGDVGVMPLDVAGDNWDYDNVSYNNFVLNSEGELYGIKLHQRERYTEESYASEGRFFICHWDKDGSFLWEKELEGIVSNENEWININTIVAKEDGSLNLLVRGNQTSRVNVDAEGNVVENVPLPDELSAVFNNLERVIPKEDGTLLAIYHDENDWQKSYCSDLNLDAGTLGEKKEIPSSIFYSWDYNVMSVRENGDLLYTTSSGIYTYTFGEAEPKPLMDFINSDLYIEQFRSVVELSDTSFIGIYSEDWQDGVKAAVFQYVDPADIADKAVIVIAGNWIGYDVKKRVIEFNQTSEEYRIVTKEYNVYNTYEDYTAGMTKLNNDLISGNMPDILINNEYNPLPIETYISKGWIADVNKLIEKDEELSQVEFMQNVFDAYSVDGKLYYVVPNFEVYTMAAKASLVGDRTGWTMEDMKQVLAGMGEEAKAFGDTTRESFMYMVMRYCGNQFVDVSTGKCNFNSEDFISMMEFAMTLPEEINYDDDYWNNYDWAAEESQYRENRTLMMAVNMYNFSDIATTINGYFGEDISFVGFPTESGNGAYLQAETTYALSARSANLDGAWQFVRYYLTDEYQKEVSYFPVNKALFFEKSKAALERPYWEDENGEKQYYDNTIYINGEEIVIPPLNQEQLDMVTDYIQSVSNRYYYNENVANIVNEEMGAFYSGQKSAQDVADVIQRRVQVYVDENS